MPSAALVMAQQSFERHFRAADLERLSASCDLVSRAPFASVDDMAANGDLPLNDIGILVTGWGSHIDTRQALAALPNLKLVAHAAGTAKSVVDYDLLASGVKLTTAARANAEPVAEFSLSWILRWNKRLDAYEAEYRAARGDYPFWRRGDYSLGNLGRTVGIISGSHVGQALVRMLQPFDIACLIYDPFLSHETATKMGAQKVELDDLLRASDVVSLNAPLLPSTVGMIGQAELAAMKDGALFLNTARGGLVDHDALATALDGGRISAVLDVTEPEPLPSDSPLWEMDNVHITPHVAGSLGSEIGRMTDWCLSEIERFVSGEPLRSEIALADWERAA